LFVDLLGVRARWHDQGRAGAETAFKTLEDLVVSAVAEQGGGAVLAGAIESDAAAIVCSSQHAAVCIGVALYRAAFSVATSGRFARPWLRGVIVPYSGNVTLKTEQPVGAANLRVTAFEGGLLDAVAVEKAGYKGMRLLIDSSLVNATLRGAHCLHLPDSTLLHVFKRLTNSPYPGRLSPGYDDIFWMASLADEWQRLQWTMGRRLRFAAKDSEEFLHAAATQLLFLEYGAILGSLTGQHAPYPEASDSAG
jgi:hypothetical protein